MGLRLAARSNGVAKLHGAVSREMFQGLWPDLAVDEVPIGSITNGVHGRTWVSPRVDALLSRVVGEDWHGADAERWARVREIDSDGGMGHAERRPRRARAAGSPALGEDVLDSSVLTDRVRPPLRHVQAGDAAALGARPAPGAAARRRAAGAVRVRRQGPPRRHAGQGADPAHRAVRPHGRRPAPLRVPHRLRHLDRPRDVPRLRRVAEHAAPAARGVRHVGHEGGAQRRAQLQHPRRLVGRVLRTARNGWAIESAEDDPDQDRRDLREVGSLFGILENQVVPRFYDRGRDGVPRQWVEMVLKAWATLGPEVTAARMVRDYTTDALRAGGAPRRSSCRRPAARPAVELAAWRERVDGGVGRRVGHVRRGRRRDTAGRRPPRTVTVEVELGGLTPDDVCVQVVHGPLGHDGEFDEHRGRGAGTDRTGHLRR